MATRLSPQATGSVRDSCSASEWKTRVELAAFYRLVEHHAWIDLIYNHLTARIPDEPGHYLVNAFGLSFDEVTASNLVKVDLASGAILDADAQTNVAAHDLHAPILVARPDLQCVAHVHTPEIMAVSAMAQGLLPATQTAMAFHNRLGYFDYGFGPDACERMARSFADVDTVILRNHGSMVGGRTIAEAYVQLHNLQMACKAQVMLMAAGREIVIPSDEILNAQSVGFAQFHDRPGGPRDGENCVEWQAALRMLARKGVDLVGATA